MGLEKFVKGQTLELNSPESRKEKVALLFDMHNLIFRTIFVAWAANPTNLEFTEWKILTLQSINASVRKFSPDRVIFAIDKESSWRKEYYPEYKAHRAALRKDSAIDFEAFFPVMNNFLEDCQKMFSNCYFLRKNRCEGDDWVPVVTNHILPDWKIITIYADRDMYQCHKHLNYSQYDPVKKKMISCPNPKEYLLLKIILGDSGDNIPAIAPRTGKVGAVKLYKNLDEELKNPLKKANFERNKVLIDFDCIPQDVIELMKKTWDEYEITEFKARDLMSFFAKHKISALVDNMHEIINNFKPLI